MWLLAAAWLCLAVPLGGLVYMTREWLFVLDGDVPWIALAMVWLLLIAYSMFGVVPTGVYLTRTEEGILVLPSLLDGLNLLSKFPVPILILIAFATRPAGFQPCSG